MDNNQFKLIAYVYLKEKTHECPECSRSFRHKGNLIRHMALHDPDSSAKEKAIALKIGRQKKIQIIDGKKHLSNFVHSFYI